MATGATGTEATDGLTDREREVLRLLLAGHTAKSAAAELDLSVHTVNDHLREARRKLGVSSSREAARLLAGARTPPEKSAPEQMGIPDTQTPAHPANTQTDRPAFRRPAIWIAGGVLMTASILAIAILTLSPGSPQDVSRGAAQAAEAARQAQREAAQARREAEQLQREGSQAALEWLGIVDRGAFGASWDAASPTFREALTRQSWATQVAAVREPLGPVEAREVTSTVRYDTLPGSPPGDYLVVQFATDFAETAGRVETVVLTRAEDGWKVGGYFIR